MSTRSVIETAGKKLRTKNISHRVKQIVISPIKEMSIVADEWHEKTGADIISFGQGIPWWDTPEYVKKGIRKSLNEIDTAKYTLEPGITELRELIAKHLESSRSIKRVLPKQEVMVTVGCQEAVDCAIASLVDPGDEVLLLEPGFASHIEQILQFGGKPIFVPLQEIPGKGWRFDPKELEKRVTKKSRVILFSNPSNPTGMVLSKKEVLEIGRLAMKHNLIVITDETYDFLVYDSTKHYSIASFPAFKDHFVLCGSFSKKYALTGYRVGFAYADEGLIDHMLKVHDALAICAPAISQKAAIAGLTGGKKRDEFLRESFARFENQRTLMCKELDTMHEIFEYERPMGAYYILVRIKLPKINSFKLVLKILHEANVIVIPGAAFGPSGENHIRFSFAGKPELITKGFKRLRAWAEKWKAERYKL